MLALVSPAAAASRWSPMEVVADGWWAMPRLLALPDGGAVMAYEWFEPYAPRGPVQAQTKPPGGPFGAPVTLSAKNTVILDFVRNWAGDTALLVGGSENQQSLVKPRGAPWGPATPLPPHYGVR